jgi:hypothetical protein
MVHYRYATLPARLLVRALASAGSGEPGEEMARRMNQHATDEVLRAYGGLIGEGYRWVRTDGDAAIFEYEVPDIKLAKDPRRGTSRDKRAR